MTSSPSVKPRMWEETPLCIQTRGCPAWSGVQAATLKEMEPWDTRLCWCVWGHQALTPTFHVKQISSLQSILYDIETGVLHGRWGPAAPRLSRHVLSCP